MHLFYKIGLLVLVFVSGFSVDKRTESDTFVPAYEIFSQQFFDQDAEWIVEDEDIPRLKQGKNLTITCLNDEVVRRLRHHESPAKNPESGYCTPLFVQVLSHSYHFTSQSLDYLLSLKEKLHNSHWYSFLFRLTPF